MPDIKVILALCQKSTLVKAKIQGIIDFLKNKSIKKKKNIILQANNISSRISY